MQPYDHLALEKKWRDIWDHTKLYATQHTSPKPKFYILDMFPYPSGQGLHVGHPKGYIGTDVVSRYKRMSNFNVLHPMGFDAFGLPAENYAIKNKVHPRVAVEKNIANYKQQLESIGFDYDWSREINTTDPKYYRWTQWIFLQLLKKGLAYESYEPINWCPSCQTGLANEDLEQGVCERCKSVVEKKLMRQWTLRITQYADRLLNDLDALEWPESVKDAQRNWIGRSEGAEFDFAIEIDGANEKSDEKITVFTTRADTLFGVTYVVLAPEHPLVAQLAPHTRNAAAVADYVAQTARVSEIDRTTEGREKTGVQLEGVFAINPANNERVPVWIADYVVGSYGTGAVMAVPAHDERDFVFAKKYTLPVRYVVSGGVGEHEAYTDEGTLINSGEYSESATADARGSITKAFGRSVVKYKLREWVFSRQRYWGEPIPVVHCEKDGVVPVPESELPVALPEVESYAPTGTGESPLADIHEWVNTTCPVCDGPAKRETNTMPQWAGSCWYYLRYMDPNNDSAFVDQATEKYWSPVDVYVGGTEHATRHLIYARFWHKFLFDIGVVSTSEPFKRLKNQGLIMGPDGRKMSKSIGNVINPDEVVATYGADTFRLFEMFLGPFEQQADWNTESIIGPRRFIERVWRITDKAIAAGATTTSADAERILHQTIAKVGSDIDAFSFNTAISSLMICANALDASEMVSLADMSAFIQLLAPFAPHVTEELWQACGNEGSVHTSTWPVSNPEKARETTRTIAVQVNGKVRGTIEIDADASDDAMRTAALELPSVIERLEGREPARVIVVPGRLVNIVIG